MLIRLSCIAAAGLLAVTAIGQESGISTAVDCNVTVAGGGYFHLRDESADRSSLYVLKADGREKETIYASAGNIGKVLLSPKCDLVGCIEVTPDWQRTLVVVSMNGEVKLRIPGVHGFAWAPDGASIAYILGVTIEGGMEFRPSSIWIYRLNDGSARKLPGVGYDLAWAEHDGNIYVWDSDFETGVDVRKYDPRNGETKETAHRGIFFSPDGKHYYRPSYEGSDFGLYLTESDSDVTEEVTCIGDRTIFWASGWLNNSVLVAPSQTGKIFRDTLVNIETDTQCVLPGEVITFPIEGDTFKMWHEGKITEVSLDSLTFVSPEKPEDE